MEQNEVFFIFYFLDLITPEETAALEKKRRSWRINGGQNKNKTKRKIKIKIKNKPQRAKIVALESGGPEAAPSSQSNWVSCSSPDSAPPLSSLLLLLLLLLLPPLVLRLRLFSVEPRDTRWLLLFPGRDSCRQPHAHYNIRLLTVRIPSYSIKPNNTCNTIQPSETLVIRTLFFVEIING